MCVWRGGGGGGGALRDGVKLLPAGVYVSLGVAE